MLASPRFNQAEQLPGVSLVNDLVEPSKMSYSVDSYQERKVMGGVYQSRAIATATARRPLL